MSELKLSEMTSPVERIEAARPGLTKKQLKITEYMLANLDTVTFSTLAALSKACGVSETCMLRLAAKLGYSGFTDMQQAFRLFVRSRIAMSKQQKNGADIGDDSDGILQKIMNKGIESIKRTMSSINPEHFRKAVELLCGAKRVFLFGSRSSASLIEYFAFELSGIRDNVFAVSGQNSSLDLLASLTKEDMLLAVSMPRYLRVTTSVMSYVYRAGVPTVAITDALSSPLIPVTKVPLIIGSESLSYGDNILPALATVTALINAVGAACPQSKETLARNERFREQLNLYLK